MFTILRSKFKIVGLFLLSLLFTCFTLNIQVHANNQLNNSTNGQINNSSNYNKIAQLQDQQLKTLPFYWNSINVAITVQNNGDMLVTETQEYVFNKQHSNQRFRYIPLDKVDDITDVTVKENNQIIPSQVGKKNNQLWIKWKHELNPPESHTFVIKYRVVGGLHLNSNTTQVYWKAIFSDRNSLIQNAKVTVKLPESLAGKISSFTYYGGNIPISSRKLDSQTVEFIAQKSILQGKELEVKVAFPNDILQMPKPKWQKSNVSQRTRSSRNNSNWGGMILFILCSFLFLSGLSTSSNSSSSSSNSRYRCLGLIYLGLGNSSDSF